MATRFDIEATDNFFKATDTAIEIDVDEADGDPQNMNGWSLTWVFKRSQSSATALFAKTTGGSGITIGNGEGTNSLATIDIDKADTAGLTAMTGWHELYRTDAGLETLLSYGSCVLRERVSV